MKNFTIAMALFVFAVGCQAKPTQPTQESSAKTCGESEVLATVNGVDITETEVESKVPSQLRQAKIDLYNAEKQATNAVIADMLLRQAAEKANQSPEEYLQAKVGAAPKIPEEQIKQFYEQRKDRFQGKSLDDVRDLITGFLQQQATRQAQANLLAELQKGADIQWHISAPRTDVSTEGFPSRGPANAPVTIVEFSDYQCPFCGRARATVTQILHDYDGKVRYVFHDFPLSFHENSEKAHEAAYCAGEQDKYWEFYDKLFKSQQALQVDKLKQYAKEMGLNTKKFDECLDSGKYKEKIQQSIAYGQSVGVSGTPAFFINGRMLSGAQPFAAFKEVIDDELAQAH